MNEISCDILIYGGGIAGLWALNRLQRLGYQTILLETNTLGGGQTLKSQGIIHGGLKFALHGKLTDSANAVENMPKRWQHCLSGVGDIDLRSVNLLSKDQLLWSTGGLASEISGFFASKALSSRVQTLKKEDYPHILKNPQFKGQVYRLEEVVLDTPSLIQALVAPHQDFIVKNTNAVAQVFKAKHYLFTAGEGNEALTSQVTHAIPTPMQRRPLHMVMVKLNEYYPFFAHCIDVGSTPRITITTHTTQQGECVWYLGGKLAEEGIHRTEQGQIECAKQEINALFPWLPLSHTAWRSFYINRAEPLQPQGKRPDSFFLKSTETSTVAWPTKLALTPLLVDHFLATLNKYNILPSSIPLDKSLLQGFEKPTIATPIWDELFSE